MNVLHVRLREPARWAAARRLAETLLLVPVPLPVSVPPPLPTPAGRRNRRTRPAADAALLSVEVPDPRRAVDLLVELTWSGIEVTAFELAPPVRSAACS